MKKYLVSIVVLLGLCGLHGAYGQTPSQPVIAFKLGLQRWDRASNPVMLSVESRLGERLTFQPELAFGHRTQYRGALAVRNTIQAGVQGRGYLLLRQGRYFSGLYTGLYVIHHRIHWPYDHPTVAVTRQYFNSGGIVLGFQQGFLERMRVDGGLKFGYSGGLSQKTIDRAGTVISEYNYDDGFVGYLYLQLGYAF